MTKKTSHKKSTSSDANSGEDIIPLLKDDHKPLKNLIKTLKNTDKSLSERKDAFERFVPLLLSHASAEEQSLYNYMKEEEDELREKGFEGATEHSIAEQLAKETQNVLDTDEWSAKAKVLAELVEHHIEEEEDEFFPDFKKGTDAQIRAELGQQYLELKAQYDDTHPDRGGGKISTSAQWN